MVRSGEERGGEGDWIKDMQRVGGTPGHGSLNEEKKGGGGGGATVYVNTNAFLVWVILLLLDGHADGSSHSGGGACGK